MQPHLHQEVILVLLLQEAILVHPLLVAILVHLRNREGDILVVPHHKVAIQEHQHRLDIPHQGDMLNSHK